jgi:DNA-directed RNA polymerase specialized sigma24 family protein
MPNPTKSKPADPAVPLHLFISRLMDARGDLTNVQEALLRAHRDSGLSMAAIGRELGLSGARVSQLIGRAERGE